MKREEKRREAMGDGRWEIGEGRRNIFMYSPQVKQCISNNYYYLAIWHLHSCWCLLSFTTPVAFFYDFSPSRLVIILFFIIPCKERIIHNSPNTITSCWLMLPVTPQRTSTRNRIFWQFFDTSKNLRKVTKLPNLDVRCVRSQRRGGNATNNAWLDAATSWVDTASPISNQR